MFMVKVKEDLTGKTFGRLTVIKQVEDHICPCGRHMDQWLCECSCEHKAQIIVMGNSLKKQNGTRSCGCLRTEFAKNLNKTSNKFIVNLEDKYGLYGIGYCVNTGNEFYFDMTDYDIIKNYTWHEHVNQKDNYHSLETTNELSKKIRMHYLLIGKYCDHADRNPLNNRRYNLRIATHKDNARNHNKQKNNTSGIIGVGWDKACNKWVAYIGLDNKTKKLGRFTNKTDAILERLKAEYELFGEFAPQRHLFEQYKIGVNQNGGDICGCC